MGQDRSCRLGDPIPPIPGDECVLLCPLLWGVCIIVQERNSSTSALWSLVTNGGLQFGEGAAIACRIDGPLSEENNRNHTLRVAEHCPSGVRRFEFFRYG
ncbi:hypothetical protein AVEN_257198-1 [Araneus ventricosus]|uniref:Uncharacterized protein n=1 Tax=Araneus ventricosus TaxID=182803 RepID=A0A4Y2F1U7_ARAVE|nr:hypothetical protein AVEN_257198-1 [Araneus ventricosus]